ncbi:Dam family site-specific DNA-(adenine-N6)-methyltransferase [Periweissella beninensis]|uniref:Site-specific DNA-methyltransferase (adenine-specific) n=1 Tax=Periweissella beninensis TaxID=504936 RepID=A0ABT0VG96_9LACO|nr:Dam family site-specific DNA-(adenine-N6)-methyltransferase [Periweissella beninensis]
MVINPFIKWVGGKRQLLPELNKYIPVNFKNYYEPFLGGGAFLLNLQPKKAIVNDYNEELIITWKIVKEKPEELLQLLEIHQKNNSKEYYLDLRQTDRNGTLEKMTDVERAARFIYMIKTGFNGMWRVNKQGQNNIPYGKYKNPLIADRETVFKVSNYLNGNDINFFSGDYKSVLDEADTGDFVYFDPPYIPLTKTSSFTSYSAEFGYKEQVELRDMFKKLHEKNVSVLLSNSDVPLIYDLYSNIEGITINKVVANRSVGANSSSRHKVGEVLITNIEV